mmetsp:Transcript_43897/g.70536  ORF Transcript_43897/g.70536 Transcript_43897/m.70536 type:complete len:235 (-) Transcript_43897:439-1143(-)
MCAVGCAGNRCLGPTRRGKARHRLPRRRRRRGRRRGIRGWAVAEPCWSARQAIGEWRCTRRPWRERCESIRRPIGLRRFIRQPMGIAWWLPSPYVPLGLGARPGDAAGSRGKLRERCDRAPRRQSVAPGRRARASGGHSGRGSGGGGAGGFVGGVWRVEGWASTSGGGGVRLGAAAQHRGADGGAQPNGSGGRPGGSQSHRVCARDVTLVISHVLSFVPVHCFFFRFETQQKLP